jgi:hypothetical protein
LKRSGWWGAVKIRLVLKTLGKSSSHSEWTEVVNQHIEVTLQRADGQYCK